MSTYDDPAPIAASASSGRKRELAQSCSDKRLDEPSTARGSRTVGNLNWLNENLAALHDSNRFVERHGLPLERYRNF